MDTKKHVMIPGPTPVAKSIQVEMNREIQAFGDPRFVSDYKGLIGALKELLNCSGEVFPLAGSGTLAMEMAVANTTKRGDNVLVVSHGYFGDRFIEICERKGLNTDTMRSEWGHIIPVEAIEEKLSSKPYAALMVSHVDTSTGVLAPVKDIGTVMKGFEETVYIVDGVASTGGEFEDVDSMNIDILFTGSQKAFGVSPGMFILWAGAKALKRRASLGVIPEYFVDFEKWLPIMDNPSKYFATPPVSMVWALAEAVRIIQKEGYKERWARHLKNARAMQAAFEALGFTVLADERHRASTLSNLVYPDGLDDGEFRGILYEEGINVAGGLGPYAGRMMRVGHMGNIDVNDAVLTLGVIERGLYRMGFKDALGKGVAVYQKHISIQEV